uniref:Uncharacterized protein n=1 Tax=Neolamprologus brichardi TaxID=32507 RepID=A0A3Q4I3C6_NEOBR
LQLKDKLRLPFLLQLQRQNFQKKPTQQPLQLPQTPGVQKDQPLLAQDQHKQKAPHRRLIFKVFSVCFLLQLCLHVTSV